MVEECSRISVTQRLWTVHVDLFDNDGQFIERYVVSADPNLTFPYGHIWFGTKGDYDDATSSRL